MEDKNTHKIQFRQSKIYFLKSNFLKIDSNLYEIIDNHKEGLNIIKFRQRYTKSFNKFDYILGDLSHDQLRLTGFYENLYDKNSRTIETCQDFLDEFCSFDCSFFLLKKLKREF